MSSSSSSDDEEDIYYDSYPVLYDSSGSFSSSILDATLRGLGTSQEIIPLLGRQGPTSHNRAFPLLLLSSLYYDNFREQEEQDILNSVIEDSMNSYRNEMLRKNIKRRLSEDSFRIEKYNSETCRNEKCFVCLEIFEKDDCVCLLSPCNHVFHESCLKEMVQYNPICALCKVNIHTYDEEEKI